VAGGGKGFVIDCWLIPCSQSLGRCYCHASHGRTDQSVLLLLLLLRPSRVVAGRIMCDRQQCDYERLVYGSSM